jgi:hypothetical protein
MSQTPESEILCDGGIYLSSKITNGTASNTGTVFFFLLLKTEEEKTQETGSTGKNLTKYDLSTGEKARMSSGIHLSANLGNELYTRPAK